MNKQITLNNNIKIPAIGYGVFRITDPKECEEAVLLALQAGYRFIDTAAAYGNEEAVGRAIARSGIDRKELFISSKLWIPDISYEKAKKGFEASLQRLGLDYIDLFIIHQPYHDYYGAWKALSEIYQSGKIKALGLDNFTQERMADFLYWNDIKPAINFLECNALFQREDELSYLNTKNIQMLAWSPLSAGKHNIFHNPTLLSIANHHNKSVAQIILRWLSQRNIIPVVKSTNPNRMKENLDIFNFNLNEDEMLEISKLDTHHSCFHERNTAKSVEDFFEKSL